MKHSQKAVLLMLVLISVLAILPVPAFATYKYEALQFDKWYALDAYSDSMTVYKLKITDDTIVYVNWKDYDDSDDNWGYGEFYRDKKCQQPVSLGGMNSFLTEKSGRRGFALYKGTYYVQMFDRARRAKAIFSKKRTNVINKPNYCLSNALHVKRRKKIEIAQTKANNYDRWYKIVLTKKQKITISGDFRQYDIINSCDLYDSNFNSIRCTYTDGTVETDGKQPKGTYYLVVKDSIYTLLEQGKYYCLSLN